MAAAHPDARGVSRTSPVPLLPAATTISPPIASFAACPEETHWDGFICAHVRATCGGWNGVSCSPSNAAPLPEERAAWEEFAAIDEEARTICPEEDESKQVFSGNAPDIVKVLDVSFSHADRLRRRLDELTAAESTPGWTVATSARIGSIYDCIWNSLRQTKPTTYFTAQQQALLGKLQATASLNCMLQPCTANAIQAQIAHTTQVVANKWEETREKYTTVLETVSVRRYVTAAVLARRYALEGYDLTRASRRLPIVAAILGDEKMAQIVDALVDPTDPARERHLIYVAHAFSAAP